MRNRNGCAARDSSGGKIVKLDFRADLGLRYSSPAQRARALTEDWISSEFYCPCCGATPLRRTANNTPASDFSCPRCGEEFELKSSARPFGPKVVDGAYGTMMARARSTGGPNLLLLEYARDPAAVRNLVAIPGQFLIPDIVNRRQPLAVTARRAGWVGCTLSIGAIPLSGQVRVVRSGVIRPMEEVLSHWRQVLFLRQGSAKERGWLVSTMRCVERLGTGQFTLGDVYGFQNELQDRFPDNRHVRAKIRQQLQVLRDHGYLRFLGDGRYELLRRFDAKGRESRPDGSLAAQ